MSRPEIIILNLIVISLLFPCAAFAQKKKKNSEREYVNVFLPKGKPAPVFIYGEAEFDSLTKAILRIPILSLHEYAEGKVTIHFGVDTLGKIMFSKVGKAQIWDQNEEFVTNPSEFRRQKAMEKMKVEAIRFIELTSGLWKPCLKNGLVSTDTFKVVINFKKNPTNTIELAIISWKPYNPGMDPNLIMDTVRAKGADTTLYAIQINPMRNRNLLYNAGVRKLKAEKVILAKVYFEEALIYEPKDKDAYYNLGVCYSKLGQIKRACISWKMAAKYGDEEAEKLVQTRCQ